MKSILLSVGYEPLGIISWRKALTLVYEEKATILWNYKDKKIRSVNQEWELPAILALKYSVKRRPKKEVCPSTKSILIRDLYVCQYCGEKITNKTGTKDHVIPKSKGGKNSWDNLVACCNYCQQLKNDKLPDDCLMFPYRRPKEPTFLQRFYQHIKISNSIERRTWKEGLRKMKLEYLTKGL